MTTWILIADAARARIFQKGGPGEKIAEARSLVHPGSRQKTSELVSDRPGRLGKGGIGGGRGGAQGGGNSPPQGGAEHVGAPPAPTPGQGVERHGKGPAGCGGPPPLLRSLS